MYPYRILIVDDELSQRDMLSGYLSKKGLAPTSTGSAETALALITDHTYEIALLDLRLPGMDGLTLLKEARKAIPDISVIMITAHGDVTSAVEAMKSGAVDYLNKPINLSELIETISKAGERFRILSENRALKEVIRERSVSTEFIGESEPVKKLLSKTYRVASTDSTVLITGESGTGKELIAGIIHKASPRSNKPFIPVACGALPDTLLESELFGYEKGAFTGAERLRLGRFELASGGTLFLDEIGELSSAVQAKLLRALEEKQIMRLGGDHYIQIDTRVVAATNRHLESEIKSGNFRQDLYYRLNVIDIEIPPLIERREDIMILTEYFLNRYSTKYRKGIKGITSAAHGSLLQYHWPGNVRELQNAIERAVVLSSGEVLDIEDFPVNLKGSSQSRLLPADITTISDAERFLITKSLAKHNWSITAAANELGLHRNTLSAKIKEYKIERS